MIIRVLNFCRVFRSNLLLYTDVVYSPIYSSYTFNLGKYAIYISAGDVQYFKKILKLRKFKRNEIICLYSNKMIKNSISKSFMSFLPIYALFNRHCVKSL